VPAEDDVAHRVGARRRIGEREDAREPIFSQCSKAAG
jgi:hypothetical protein